MKKLGHILILMIAFSWIALSFIEVYSPFTAIGKILSYPGGIYSRNLPESTLDLSGTNHELEISLDEHGIPTIVGKSSKDVAFGLGYMHARDRYFQMEMITRTVQGEVSALMGEKTLNRDIFWKPLKTDELAQKEWENLKKRKPKTYNYLLAYNNGIRYYLANESSGTQSFEYSLLGVQPREWKNHYPLLLSYYMSKMLAYSSNDHSWATNLSNLSEDMYSEWFDHRNMDQYEYMYQDTFKSPELEPKVVIDSSKLDSLTPLNLEELQNSIVVGSNNWAISGSKSGTGKSILCNDTHLDIMLPNPWYQAHLKCDEFHVQGFTIPCVPYVMTGNNERISWGITNCHWDEIDLFSLKVNDDSTGYMLNGNEQKFKVQTNVITVKGAEDYVWKTRHCEHGLVKKSASGVYAEKWYALDFESSIFAFEKVMRARNWSQFKDGLREFTFPPQNFAYTDSEGNVGMMSAGILPLRPANYKGEMLDGTKPFEPKYVRFENLPQAPLSDSGYVSSANQVQGKANYYIHHYWGAPYRAERINEFIEAKEKLLVDDMRILQTDKVDMSVKPTIALFDSIPLSGKPKEWVGELKSWNGEMNPILKTPIKYAYLQKAINYVMSKEMEKQGIDWIPEYQNILNTLEKETLDFGKLPDVKSETLLRASLDSAVFWYDKNVQDSLNYGSYSPFNMKHIIPIPGIGKQVDGKGGSSYTVDVNGAARHGASMRTIIEMGITPNVQTILAGGQSGRVNSPNYADQVGKWKVGEYNIIDFGMNSTKKPNMVFRK